MKQTVRHLSGKREAPHACRIDLTVLIGAQQHQIVGVLPLRAVQGMFTPWRADAVAASDDMSQLTEIQRPP
ncbi:hypothetical protein [Streptomyces sp. GQFP]|uniref:hypothetical protein n=1 Tax=Streptomyces sp. GQFP TaxID=2907545 RepID=UPI001F412E3A|nr:hypothetical protein [Streptomyces sp. GQFP]UIX29908.1 hypothetical protein LUX31_07590 [Streptomyces sp. GQFP]